MTSRFARLYFNYWDDYGQKFIRVQDVRKYADGSDIFPVTSTLLETVIKAREKIKINQEDRHILITIPNSENKLGVSKLQQKLPYPPNNSKLNNHVKEILAVKEKILQQNNLEYLCADYIGESKNYVDKKSL